MTTVSLTLGFAASSLPLLLSLTLCVLGLAVLVGLALYFAVCN